MGFFMRPVPSGVTKPTLESGLTLVTANSDIDFDIVNNDVSNPAAVDLAFTTPAIQAVAFDQGTAQSPSYVLEAGATRTISLVRDYGAKDYGTVDGDVTESVNARLPDGTLASQTLTVEPFIDVANAAQPDGFCTFNGSSDYLSTPYNAAYDFALTDSFSIAFWINMAAGTTSCSVIGTYDVTNNEGFLVQASGAGSPYNDTALVYLFSAPSNYAGIRSTLKVMTGGWTHYCCTYDGTWTANGYSSMKQYIDGALDTPQQTFTTGTVTQLNSSDPLAIGASPAPAQWFLNGSLDDIGIWSRVLTSVEIASIYTNKTRCHKVQRSDLVCYYDFDYVSGSLTNGIKDRTTNGLDMVKG